MQGKGVIKFFAILLAVVCLYQLSFTWVARKVESDAKVYSKGDTEREKAYLDSMSTQPVYPLLKHNYQYVKQRELALGLDLKGGMNVTMQISLNELVRKIANNNPDVTFNQALENADKLQADAKTTQKDFISLFVSEYEKLNPNGKLAAIFSTRDNQDHLKFNASNSEVESYLKDQANTAVKQSYTVLNTRINQFGVTQPNIQLEQSSNRILVELPGVKEPERVRKLLQGSAKLEFYETFDNTEAYQYLINIDNLLAAKNKTAKTDSSKTAAATAATTTAKTDTAAKAGSLLSKVQKNAAKDTSALANKTQLAASHPLFALMSPNIGQDQSGQQQLGQGPVVGYAPLRDTAKINSYLHSADVMAVIPRNLKFLWEVKPIKNNKDKAFALYAIKLSGADNGPVLSGDVINDASKDVDQKGSPEVRMVMNSQGAEKWRTITAEASSGTNKKAIAIVLDDNVYSAPTVQNEISGGVSSISGNFTIEDTQDLANVLKAGRLPAPAHIISEAVVGPSLGQEAINAGVTSSILGLVVVLIFMIAYYNRAGTVAVVAVIINIFFLMGVLTSLGAVLTLPGIAGIVLTLGIAVDANVLVYERVREELALGKSLRIAVADGFKHALPSILDSQISTFLTGLILFIFGSGPIQGFATTLMIGIITSLFCSLLISRVIFEWMLDKGWDIKFSNPWSSHTFKNAAFKFVKNRFKFYIFSGLFITAGLISIVTRGFSYGVDFEGGRNYIITFPNKGVTTEVIHDAVDATLGRSTEVKTFGADKISITTNLLIRDNNAATDAKVKNTLIQALNSKEATRITDKDIVGFSKVSATVADELKTSAIYTVLFAIFVISAYILIRFRKWQFSLGAMVATAHDALLVLSFFSLFRGILPFSLDIDQAFIAAILTVIGYSINDTVVVFDRIREFLELHHAKTDNPEEVINQAINSTLSRTIITALTVIFVLIVLFVFGGDVIKGFSFALLIGVIFGTYSSICVATPVIVDFGKKDLR
ncbi:protein translocase subunit SecDF [Mucilaginibacter sabulilitoris]|uniref:Multifunctional fusion protein n=1 Tax=Mucilaginibacter sabulilitoris TaxID=1173583 RepID=A0ABZ0TK41_9SPHI|nr:protein translocase subunit SecDF [Mucilaginibacter sabulilitoris]WPU92553.1 protein translocase subunit SecDF [Mucilaginibacter sabulilitoris]